MPRFGTSGLYTTLDHLSREIATRCISGRVDHRTRFVPRTRNGNCATSVHCTEHGRWWVETAWTACAPSVLSGRIIPFYSCNRYVCSRNRLPSRLPSLRLGGVATTPLLKMCVELPHDCARSVWFSTRRVCRSGSFVMGLRPLSTPSASAGSPAARSCARLPPLAAMALRDRAGSRA